MSEIDKNRIIETAQKLGFIVSFSNESGIYVTDGDIRRKIEWEEVLPELKELED